MPSANAFQFGLGRLLAAVALGAFTVLLTREAVAKPNLIIWTWASIAAGATVGVLFHRTREGASLGCIAALLALAAYAFWYLMFVAADI